MKRVWPRAATCGLAALASVWLTTSTSGAPGSVEQCEIPNGGPLSGTYEGKFSGMLVASGGGQVNAVFQNKVEGTLSVKVTEAKSDQLPQVTAGEGDVRYGMLGTGGESPAAGKVFAAIGTEQSGSLEFESGGAESFTLSGRLSGGGLKATGVGKTVTMSKTVGGGGSAGSLTVKFKPDLYRSDCYTLRGTLQSPELEQMAAGFRSSGLVGTWDASFQATLTDDNGMRAESERVKSEVTSVPPKPRPNAILKYREVLKEIDGSSRTDVEKACLRVSLWEAYLPRSRMWLKEDLDELKQLGKRAGSGTELDRTRIQRLVGQSLGRAAESMLLGCKWSEAEAAIPTCEATMSAVIDVLLKQNQGLWDQASVRNLLQWTYAASVLGGNSDKALGVVQQWALGVATAKYDALVKLGMPKTPADNAAFVAALREALAASRQALWVGTNPPDPLKIWEKCKAKGACA